MSSLTNLERIFLVLVTNGHSFETQWKTWFCEDLVFVSIFPVPGQIPWHGENYLFRVPQLNKSKNNTFTTISCIYYIYTWIRLQVPYNMGHATI